MPYADLAKQREAMRRSYLKHREVVMARSKARYASKGDECRAKIKAWKAANPEKVRAEHERYNRKRGHQPMPHAAHVTAFKAFCKEWQSANTEQDQRLKPWYGLSDTEEYRVRYAQDPDFRLKERLRRQFRKKSEGAPGLAEAVRLGLKRGGGSRTVENLLGYSIAKLRVHLERQFTGGMSWSSFGVRGWHIDHILPRKCFDLSTVDGVRAYWALSNLRPLPARENLRKHDRVESLL